MMKLKQEHLELMGFRKNSLHESVKDLFYKDLLPGLEIEVDYITGEGMLTLFDVENDRVPLRLHLRFENVAQITTFIGAINKAEFFNR